MRNLIKADIFRILRSKLLYAGLVTGIFYLILKAALDIADRGMNATGFVAGVKGAVGSGIMTVLILFPIFLAVFSHELSARSMQCILGHGLTRDKLIIAKLLDAAIVLTVFFVFITLALIWLYDPSYALSSRQSTNIFIFIWLRAFRIMGYLCFAAMVMYITGSSSAGVIVCSAFAVFFPVSFKLIEMFSGASIYDYTFDGLLDWAYTSIETGSIGWQLFPAFLYVAAAVFVTVIFFRRKEFEF